MEKLIVTEVLNKSHAFYKTSMQKNPTLDLFLNKINSVLILSSNKYKYKFNSTVCTSTDFNDKEITFPIFHIPVHVIKQQSVSIVHSFNGSPLFPWRPNLTNIFTAKRLFNSICNLCKISTNQSPFFN